jgi:hypothetical protein
VTKRRVIFALTVVGVVVGLLGVVIFVQYPSYRRAKQYTQEREEHARLSRMLYMALKSKQGARVDLGRAVSAWWDRLFILAPYTAYEATQRSVPGAWHSSDHDGLDRRDDICVLAFFNQDKLVERLSIQRADVDFSELARERSYGREEAVFFVREGRVVH